MPTLTQYGLMLETQLKKISTNMPTQAEIILQPLEYINEDMDYMLANSFAFPGMIEDFRNDFIKSNENKKLSELINEGIDIDEMMSALKEIFDLYCQQMK